MINLEIQTNIFAIVMLLTLYLSLENQTNRHELVNRLFIALVHLTITIIIFDSFQITFDGDPTVTGGILLQISTFVYFFMNPIIPLVWLIYLDHHIFKSLKHIYKIIFISSPFFIIHTILAVLSIKGDYLYYIDNANNYFRGRFLWVTTAFLYGVVVISALVVILNRKKIKQNEGFIFCS